MNVCFPSFVLFNTLRARPLNQEPLGFPLFVSTLAATMAKSYSLNPLWMMNTTIFQETSNLYHILKPIIGRFFKKLFSGVHFGAVSLIHSALRRNAATPRKVLAPFLSVM